jgi:hypothetical protein
MDGFIVSDTTGQLGMPQYKYHSILICSLVQCIILVNELKVQKSSLHLQK